MNDLVSVCIAAYNAENYIEETLLCLLKQSYQNIEIILVNDNSNDRTLKIAQKIALNFPALKIYSQPNAGAAAARNLAYKNCNGNYIIFFDADDLAEVNFIESQLKSFKNSGNEDVAVVSKWGRFYHNNLNTYKEDPEIIKKNMSFHEWVTNYWIKVGHMTPPGRVLLNRNTIEKAGLWDDNLSLNDDFDFFTRAFTYVKEIIYNDDTTFYYRSGIGGLSQQKKDVKKQLSNYTSINKSIEKTLVLFPKDENIKKACANVYQSFLYECYPMIKPVCKNAAKQIKILGGSNLKYQSGGISKILYSLFGWKATNYIKYVFGR